MNSYFFVGIGGSGMMPLAMILAARGHRVAGSDRGYDQGRVTAKFAALEALGIRLFPQDGSGVQSADQIVVASAAVEADVADMVAARRVGARQMRRAELLSALFNAAPMAIGVAGTSGKSTVTGMIAWILHQTGADPVAMNGAVMKNFAGADMPFASALVGGGDGFVSEIDESDGSIALYSPAIAVLNNVSLDHKSLDELRALFGDFLARSARAVVNVGDAEVAALAEALPRARQIRVAVDPAPGLPVDLAAANIVEAPYSVDFDLVTPDAAARRVALAVPGRHNVANALVALGAAQAAGVSLDAAVAAIAGFGGLKRRFEKLGEAAGVVVIDDFGHNPDKIAATLDTLHAHPGRLLLLFQPHGFGPLKVMRAALVETIAARLAPGDLLVLCDPAYFGGTVAREVTSADIVADLATKGAPVRYIADREEAARVLTAAAVPGDRIVVMGARDDSLSELGARMLDMLAAREASVTNEAETSRRPAE